MNFAFSEEQEELRKTVRSFLEQKSPEIEVRRLMETDEGYDPAVWKQMAEQLGLQGLIIPEEFGGSGFSYVELGVVLEEMGRALLCAPYFSTVVLAANTLLHSGDDAAKKELPARHRLGRDDRHARLHRAVGEVGRERASPWRPAESGDGWTLNGTKMFVLDGTPAGLIIVGGPHRRGRQRCSPSTATPPASPAPRCRRWTRPASRPSSSSPTRRPGSSAPRAPAGRRCSTVLDLAAVGLAAEQVGGAQKVLEMSVEYAKVRVQFGRPIGSFQAIKHKCADMLLEVESAKSAAYYGMWCAAELNDELPSVASLAKAYCSEAYFHAAAENIQIHGGIGFTWEHPAHLYFKRAKSSELLFGDPTYHRELLAQRIGI